MAGECEQCGGRLVPWLGDVADFEYGVSASTRYDRCGDCGTGVQVPIPSADDLGGFYPPDYHAYHYGSSRLAQWLKHRYSVRVGRRIKREVPHAVRILDVGCADGSFLASLADLDDWELHGIDLNAQVVGDPAVPGLRLRAGQLTPTTYPDGHFDVVVMSHLIEHVVDPLETLRTCGRILRPGGVVVGELPSLDGWDRRLFGRYWGGMHAPRHLWFWDGPGFADLARRAGFRTVEVVPAFQPAHWAISVQNLLVGHGAFRGRLRYGRIPLYPLLVLAFAPVNALQNVLGRPSIVTFTLGAHEHGASQR